MENFIASSNWNSLQEEAENITKPFLDALGDDYSVSCQGMKFFSVFLNLLQMDLIKLREYEIVSMIVGEVD